MRERSRNKVFCCGPLEIDLGRREVRSGGAAVPIGSRAFGILAVLVQSAGKIVDKRELMRQVWPGMVVEENTLHVHISTVRKVLGSEYLKTIPGRGYQLLGTWISEGARDKQKTAPQVERDSARGPPSTTNLPVVAQMLIGRAEALQQLQELVGAHRIVTLTGPGGIGKTSLAREAARLMLAGFNGDVRLVELASVSSPEMVPSAVAVALGLRIGGDEISVRALATSIEDRKVLIVLDSCEHLIDVVAACAEQIVLTCPHATIIATSRELLRIDGEYVYRVHALDVPDPAVDFEAAVRHSAVQLFIARTRAQLSDFTPRDENLPVIASICRRLDGIPLAIEFAAARVATLGLQQVAARLDDRFALLTSGRRMALDRHQTLRATLDWSYRLLSESEKRLFRRLAVFSAGFTLEAAAAIMHEPGSTISIALDDIASLVSKSFVTLDGLAFGDRWRLLETTRAYAFEKLVESGEAEKISRRHAEFFEKFMAGANLGSRVRPGSQDVARFAGEIDNVRAALDWSFSAAGDVTIGVHLTAAFAPVWLHSALLLECCERIERALNAVAADSVLDKGVRMRLYLALGYAMVFTMGNAERTRGLLTVALTLAEEMGDRESQLSILGGLAALQFMDGESQGAQETAERVLVLARQTNDPVAARLGERLSGNALQFWGRQAEAQLRLENVLNLPPLLQDNRRGTRLFRYDQHALARAMLARVLWLRGAASQAVKHARASLKEIQASNDQLSLCWVLYYGMIPVSFMTADLDTAEQSVAMLVDPAVGLSSGIWRIIGSLFKGKLMVARGDGEEGIAMLRSGIEMSDRQGWTLSYPEFLCSLAQGLAALGRHAEAITRIDQGLSLASSDREQWYQPELIRTKGELLLEQSGGEAASVAAECFDEAINLAQIQGALSWELRAAHSLARLRCSLGQGKEAAEILQPVYLKFTEGFDTPDLKAAKATLDSVNSL